MNRKATAILVFLLLGAILNIAVAWACVLWSSVSKISLLTDYPEYQADVRGLPADQTIATGMSKGFGVVRFTFTWHVPAEAHAIWHIRAGWPCESMAGQIDVEGKVYGALSAPRWLYGMVDAPDRRPLPITPLARGFAINSVIWALLIAAITLGPGWLRRLHRVRSDRCVNCGYDLCGAVHDRCPECGTLVQAAGH